MNYEGQIFPFCTNNLSLLALDDGQHAKKKKKKAIIQVAGWAKHWLHVYLWKIKAIPGLQSPKGSLSSLICSRP